jgi:multiple sugar transport system permease protein
MFLDSLFYESLFNTFYQVFGTVAVQMIIGIPIALLLSRQLKYIKIIKSLYFLPFMMTPIVVGLVWRMLYSADHGIVNYFLESLFIEKQNWLGDYYLAMPAVIFVDIWLSTPFVVMLLIAGIFAIPEELYDAAKAEGGSDWQIFWFITFPLLTPILLLTVIFRIIDSFKRFDTIYIMTAGGPGTATETLNLHAYFHGFEYLNIGYASTISVTILIIVSIFSIYLANKLISSQSVY